MSKLLGNHKSRHFSGLSEGMVVVWK